MDDLKPCPFCGGNAVVRRVLDITPWYVRCDNPDCVVWVVTFNRDTAEEAIKLWNTRAT